MGERWKWKKSNWLTWTREMGEQTERKRARGILSLQSTLGLEYGGLGLMKLSNMKLLMSICEIYRPWAKEAWSQKDTDTHTHKEKGRGFWFILFYPLYLCQRACFEPGVGLKLLFCGCLNILSERTWQNTVILDVMCGTIIILLIITWLPLHHGFSYR